MSTENADINCLPPQLARYMQLHNPKRLYVKTRHFFSQKNSYIILFTFVFVAPILKRGLLLPIRIISEIRFVELWHMLAIKGRPQNDVLKLNFNNRSLGRRRRKRD